LKLSVIGQFSENQMSEQQQEQQQIQNVCIIGAGCAGLTAGIYAGRAELKPLIFAGSLEEKGGLLTKTSIVENYPGFPEGVMGLDLIFGMEKQAENVGAKVINRSIVKFDFSKKPYTLIDDEGTSYFTNTVIVATGSSPIKLGLQYEDKFWSSGISSCAVCDGALYKKKNIIVVGGGDSAMEEALFLTKFSDVILIHRRDTFRASKVMIARVLNHPKIKVITDTVIEKLEGEKKLKSITIKNLKDNTTSQLEVDGLFYGLGLKPNTSLFKGALEMDSDGYIEKKGKHFETMTSIEGVFVAGDAHDKVYRQAIVASGDGCKAAMDANNYINEHLQ
jgi:thioredoxin reductase (NADPH)